MSLDTLHDLLVDNLKDLYNAERQLVTALPRMAKGATTPELRDALESHLTETEGQMKRIERVFEILDEPKRGKMCAGMKGLIEEGKEILEEEADDAVRDAGIIVAAQKVEHYEIAAYANAIKFADLLGEDEVVAILEETLEEEKAADEKLTAIAEGDVNERALAPSPTEE
jgi:ferritin-like metal-binding protein YciE